MTITIAAIRTDRVAPRDIAECCSSNRGSRQIHIGQIGIGQIGGAKVHPAKIAVAEVRTRKVCILQVRSGHVRACEIRTGEAGICQIDTRKRALYESRRSEIDASQIHPSGKCCSRQIGCWSKQIP